MLLCRINSVLLILRLRSSQSELTCYLVGKLSWDTLCSGDMWMSHFYQEQLHSVLKTFYQPFIQNVFCKLNSEDELNSYCLADFRVFFQDKTLICVHIDNSLQLPVKEMPFKVTFF